MDDAYRVDVEKKSAYHLQDNSIILSDGTLQLPYFQYKYIELRYQSYSILRQILPK